MLRCSKCDAEILEKRIIAILDATGELPDTCINCSNEPRRFGTLVFAHKTGGDTVVLKGDNKEHIRLARRAYQRSR